MLDMFLTPIQTNYAAQFPGALTVGLDSPASFSRKDVNNTFPVSVSWSVDAYGYQYLRSFFRGGVDKGSAPFNVNLVLENSTVSSYQTFFVPGSWQLTTVEGDKFTVQATLEVLSPPADDAYDDSLFAVYQAFGEDVMDALNLFNVIVNIKWPT